MISISNTFFKSISRSFSKNNSRHCPYSTRLRKRINLIWGKDLGLMITLIYLTGYAQIVKDSNHFHHFFSEIDRESEHHDQSSLG